MTMDPRSDTGIGGMERSRERLIRWGDPVALAQIAQKMGGREFLERVQAGEFPLPPICELIGFTFKEFGDGLAIMTLRPDESHSNPMATVHGGVIATLLDSVMGCAVHTLLPAGPGYTTLEFKVNFLKPLKFTDAAVDAIGSVIHSGRRTALAEGKLIDDSGRVFAHATTTCLLL